MRTGDSAMASRRRFVVMSAPGDKARSANNDSCCSCHDDGDKIFGSYTRLHVQHHIDQIGRTFGDVAVRRNRQTFGGEEPRNVSHWFANCIGGRQAGKVPGLRLRLHRRVETLAAAEAGEEEEARIDERRARRQSWERIGGFADGQESRAEQHRCDKPTA